MATWPRLGFLGLLAATASFAQEVAPSASPSVLPVTSTTCELQLDYSIPFPHGCPLDECVVRQLPSGTQVCEPRRFWDQFSAVYWGSSGLPIGYLFWNFLLGVCLIVTTSVAPWALAWAVTTLVNSFMLKPSKTESDAAAIKIRSLRVALLGGKVTFEELEYASTNVHLRVVEGGISLKWWLSSDSILRDTSSLFSEMSQSKSELDSAASLAKKVAVGGSSKVKPFRVSTFMSGVELSVYNNTEKFTAIERSITSFFSKGGIAPSDKDLERMETGTAQQVRHRERRRREASRREGGVDDDDEEDDEDDKGEDEDEDEDANIIRSFLCCFRCRKKGWEGRRGRVSTRRDKRNRPRTIRRSTSDESAEGREEETFPENAAASSVVESSSWGSTSCVPWFYRVFPVSKVELSQFCIYMADPSLKSTLVVHAERGFGVHHFEHSSFEYDLYKVVNRAVWTNVRVRLVKNESFTQQGDFLSTATVLRAGVDDGFIGGSVVRFFRDLFPFEYRPNATKRRESGFFSTPILGGGGDGDQSDQEEGADTAISPGQPLSPGLAVSQDEEDDDEEEVEEDDNLGSRKRRGSYDEVAGVLKVFGKVLNIFKIPTRDTDLEHQGDDADEEQIEGPPTPTPAMFVRRSVSSITVEDGDEGDSFLSNILYYPNRRLRYRGSTDLNSPPGNGAYATSMAQLQGHRGHQQQQHHGNRRKSGRKRISPGSSSKKDMRLAEPDILRTERLEVVYKYDEPGPVTPEQIESFDPKQQPEFSLTLVIGAASSQHVSTILNYGPWADQQRIEFLQRFLPTEYTETSIYHPSSMEKIRKYIFMESRVRFEGKTNLRIPYRARNGGWYDGTSETPSYSGPSIWTAIEQQLSALRRAETLNEEMRQRTSVFGSEESRPFSSACSEGGGAGVATPSSTDATLTQTSSFRTGWLLDLPDHQLSVLLAPGSPLAEEISAILDYQRALLRIAQFLTTERSYPSAEHRPDVVAQGLWMSYSGRESQLRKHVNRISPNCSPADEMDLFVRRLPAAERFQTGVVEFLAKYGIDPADSRRELEGARGSELEFVQRLQARYGDDHPELKHIKSIIKGSKARIPLDFERIVMQVMNRRHNKHDSVAGAPSTTSQADEFAPLEHVNENHFEGPLSYAKAHGQACGWVDVEFSDGSSIVASIPLQSTSENGYETILHTKLAQPQVKTSVTQNEVLRSGEYEMRASLKYSNKWNDRQLWSFNQSMKRSLVRIVRDDIHAFMDLIWDWTSNALPEAEKTLEFFVPITYSMQVDMDRVNCILIVNENNVVSNLMKDEQNHVVDLEVPKVRFRSEMSTTEFNSQRDTFDWNLTLENNKDSWTSSCGATLCLPKDHRRRSIVHPRPAFLDNNKVKWTDPRFLVFDRLEFDGRYTYHNFFDEENVDTVRVGLHFSKPRLLVIPEAIESLMNFQANYFGADMFLITPDDFIASGRKNLRSRIAFQNWKYSSTDGMASRPLANQFELIFNLDMTDACAQIPISLEPCMDAQGDIQDPDYSVVSLTCSEVAIDMRYNYDSYQDLCLKIAPVRIRVPSSQALGTRSLPAETNPGLAPSMAAEDEGTRSSLTSAAQGQSGEKYNNSATVGGTGSTGLPGPYSYPKVLRPKYRSPRQHRRLKRPLMENGIGSASTGHLLWDGIEFNCQWLYGRDQQVAVCPFVAYNTTRKVTVGMIRGDMQTAQMHALYDVLDSFALGWSMKHTSKDVVDASKAGALTALPRRIFNRLIKTENRILIRVDLIRGMNIPSEKVHGRVQRGSRPHVFAEVSCAEQVFRTRVSIAPNPEWENASYIFFLPDFEADIEVALYDGSYGRKHKIGTVTLNREWLKREKMTELEASEISQLLRSEKPVGRVNFQGKTGKRDNGEAPESSLFKKLKETKFSVEARDAHDIFRHARERARKKNAKYASVKAGLDVPEFIYPSKKREAQVRLAVGLFSVQRHVFDEIQRAHNALETGTTTRDAYLYAATRWKNTRTASATTAAATAELWTPVEVGGRGSFSSFRTSSVDLASRGLQQNSFTASNTEMIDSGLPEYSSQGMSFDQAIFDALLQEDDFQDQATKFGKASLSLGLTGADVCAWMPSGKSLVSVILTPFDVFGDTKISRKRSWFFKSCGEIMLVVRQLTRSDKIDSVSKDSSKIAGQDPSYARFVETGGLAQSNSHSHDDSFDSWVQLGFIQLGVSLKLERRVAHAIEEEERQATFLQLFNASKEEKLRLHKDVTGSLVLPLEAQVFKVDYKFGVQLCSFDYSNKAEKLGEPAEERISVVEIGTSTTTSKSAADDYDSDQSSFASARSAISTSSEERIAKGELSVSSSSDSESSSSSSSSSASSSGYSSSSSSDSREGVHPENLGSPLSPISPDSSLSTLHCAVNSSCFVAQPRRSHVVEVANLLPYLEHFELQTLGFAELEAPSHSAQRRQHALQLANTMRQRVKPSFGESECMYTHIKGLGGGPCCLPLVSEIIATESFPSMLQENDSGGEPPESGESKVLKIDSCRVIDIFITPEALHDIEEALASYHPVCPNIDQLVNFFEKLYLMTGSVEEDHEQANTGKFRAVLNLQGINLRMLHTSVPMGDVYTHHAETTRKCRWKRHHGQRHRMKPIPYLSQLCCRRLEFSLTQRTDREIFTPGGSKDTPVSFTGGFHVEEFEIRLGILRADVSHSPSDIENRFASSRGLFLMDACNVAHFRVRKVDVSGEAEGMGIRKRNLSIRLDRLDLDCGTDAVKAVFTAMHVWVRAVQSLLEVRTGVYFRRRHQWALLAGQVLRLAGQLDRLQPETIASEDEKTQAFADLCRFEEWDEYNDGRKDLTPQLIVNRFRRIACFIPVSEHVLQEIASCRLDRYANVNPISLEVLAGVAPDDHHLEPIQRDDDASSKLFFQQILNGCAEEAMPNKHASFSRKPNNLDLNMRVDEIRVKVLVSDSLNSSDNNVPAELVDSFKKPWTTMKMVPASKVSLSGTISMSSITFYKEVQENKRPKGHRRRSKEKDQQQKGEMVAWIFDIEYLINSRTHFTKLSSSPEIIRSITAAKHTSDQLVVVLQEYYGRRRIASNMHETEINSILLHSEPSMMVTPFGHRLGGNGSEMQTRQLYRTRGRNFIKLPSSTNLNIPFEQTRVSNVRGEDRVTDLMNPRTRFHAASVSEDVGRGANPNHSSHRHSNGQWPHEEQQAHRGNYFTVLPQRRKSVMSPIRYDLSADGYRSNPFPELDDQSDEGFDESNDGMESSAQSVLSTESFNGEMQHMMDQVSVFISTCVEHLELELRSTAQDIVLHNAHQKDEDATRAVLEMQNMTVGWSHFSPLLTSRSEKMLRLENKAGTEPTRTAMGTVNGRVRDFVLVQVDSCAGLILGACKSVKVAKATAAKRMFQTKCELHGLSASAVAIVERNTPGKLGLTLGEPLSSVQVFSGARGAVCEVPFHLLDHKKLQRLGDDWASAYQDAKNQLKAFASFASVSENFSRAGVRAVRLDSPVQEPIAKEALSARARQRRRSFQDQIEMIASAADVVPEATKSIQKPRYTISIRCQDLRTLLQPHSKFLLSYTIETVTFALGKKRNGKLEAEFFVDKSFCGFEKRQRKSSNFSTDPSENLSFRQSLPRVWISASLAASKRRMPVVVKGSGTGDDTQTGDEDLGDISMDTGKSTATPRRFHRKTNSLESVSLLSESGESTRIEDSATAGKIAPKMPGVEVVGSEDDSELVLRLRVVVESLENKFTPDIVEQFLVLQSGLAQEINSLLAIVTKVSAKVVHVSSPRTSSPSRKGPKKKNSTSTKRPPLKVRTGPHQDNEDGAHETGSSFAPRRPMRYSLHFIFGGISLTALSDNHKDKERINSWAELNTGSFQLIAKSAYSQDFISSKQHPPGAFLAESSDMVWFVSLKFKGMRCSLYRRIPPLVATADIPRGEQEEHLERLFEAKTNIKVLYDPRSSNEATEPKLKEGMMDVARYVWNQTCTVTVNDTRVLIQCGCLATGEKLSDEYIKAFRLYQYMRTNERQLLLAAQDEAEAESQFEQMHRYVRVMWKNVKEPIESELRSTKMYLKALRRLAINVSVDNTSISLPFRLPGQKRGEREGACVVGVYSIRGRGYVDNLVTALFDNLHGSESVEVLHKRLRRGSALFSSSNPYLTDQGETRSLQEVASIRRLRETSFHGNVVISELTSYLTNESHAGTKDVFDLRALYAESSSRARIETVNVSIEGKSGLAMKDASLRASIVTTATGPDVELDAHSVSLLAAVAQMHEEPNQQRQDDLEVNEVAAAAAAAVATVVSSAQDDSAKREPRTQPPIPAKKPVLIDITFRMLKGEGLWLGTCKHRKMERLELPTFSLGGCVSHVWVDAGRARATSSATSGAGMDAETGCRLIQHPRRNSYSEGFHVPSGEGQAPIEMLEALETKTSLSFKIELSPGEVMVSPLCMLFVLRYIKESEILHERIVEERAAAELSPRSAVSSSVYDEASDGKADSGVEEGEEESMALPHSLSWSVLFEINEFDVVARFEALSAGDDVSVEMAVPQGIHGVWSSGDEAMADDRTDPEDRFLLECRTLSVGEVKFSIHQPVPFSELSLSRLSAQVNQAHGLMQLPVVVSMIDIDKIAGAVNVEFIDKLFGLEYGWQREWRRAEKIFNRVDGDESYGSSTSASSGSSSSSPKQSETQQDSAISGSTDEVENFDNEEEDLLMGGGGGFADRRYETATKMIEARLGKLNLEVDLGNLHSKMVLTVFSTCGRYFQPQRLSNETFSEIVHLYVDSKLVEATFDGRVEGELRLYSGFLVHLMRDSQQMPTIDDLMNHPSYISANEFNRYHESTPAPANDWQPWMKKKQALNHAVLRLRDKIYSDVALVFGNDSMRSRTSLFELDTYDFSIYVSEVIPDTNVCTQIVSIYSTHLNMQSSSETLPFLWKLAMTMQEQVQGAKTLAKTRFKPSTTERVASHTRLSDGSVRVEERALFDESGGSLVDRKAVRVLKAVGTIYFEIGKFDVSVVHGVLNDVKRSAAAAISLDRSAKFSLEVEKKRVSVRRELIIEIEGNCEVSRFEQLLVKGSVGEGSGKDSVASSASSYPHGGPSKSSKDLRDHKRKHRGRKRVKLVFGIPPSKITMLTTQSLSPPDRAVSTKIVENAKRFYILLPKIKYVYNSGFVGPIYMSTDIRDYTYLKEIVQSCRRSLHLQQQQKQQQQQQQQSSSSQQQPQSRQEKLRKMDLKRQFVQDRDEPDAFVFNPQVNVMGEATTIALNIAMSRLDLNKERLPEKTHILLTDNLEEVLALVHDGLRLMDKAFGDK